ncbi:MAG: glycosyltransferase family 2 protein [Armatimonadota bacterium]|nr:glycosyltransferase family 2 protein [Armatimonadota bacterium]
MAKPIYSLVIPIYNEEETLPELHRRLSELMERLDAETEIIMVDDGSSDQSFQIMSDISRRDKRFKIIQLSRNFGHQTAITAGMDSATGEAVIIMDADLQDPPEVALDMIARWREGYEVVYGARDEREGESVFKKATAAVFYRTLRKLTDLDIPLDVGDFRLVDRKAMDVFNTMREHSRYVRGMFSWIGFKQTGVKYKRSSRFAGSTKYPLKKMLKLAMDGVISFSTAPLRLALNAGFFIAAISFLAGTWAIFVKLFGSGVIPGWTSILVVVSFMNGVQLILIGLLGEYIGRIYEEVKGRPLYIVKASRGFPENSISEE